jgi:hypothetical protein
VARFVKANDMVYLSYYMFNRDFPGEDFGGTQTGLFDQQQSAYGFFKAFRAGLGT